MNTTLRYTFLDTPAGNVLLTASYNAGGSGNFSIDSRSFAVIFIG